MNPLAKGNRVAVVCVAASLLAALWLTACDEPPKAPEPTVDLDEKQEALRDKVESVQSDTKKRVDQLAEQIPRGDTDLHDASSPSDQ